MNEIKEHYFKISNPYKKLYKFLLISLIFLVIIFSGTHIYMKINYEKAQKENEVIIERVLQLAVSEYIAEYKKNPVDNSGNVDINILKNKGFITINIELENVNYLIDRNGQIHKR